jgi:hypothetical protein
MVKGKVRSGSRPVQLSLGNGFESLDTQEAAARCGDTSLHARWIVRTVRLSNPLNGATQAPPQANEPMLGREPEKQCQSADSELIVQHFKIPTHRQIMFQIDREQIKSVT